MPVALDLGTVGHVEPHAGEDGLDTFQRATHGVQATTSHAASRQGHIQSLGTQLRRQLFVGQLLAPRGQGNFDRLLGHIDRCAA